MSNAEHVRILFDEVEFARFQRSGTGTVDATGAQLRDVNLSRRHLQGVDFSGADLRGSSSLLTRLSQVIFDDARLEGALIADADLFACSLVSADLSGASLTGATLINGDASRANFRNASLGWAALRGVRLDGANFADAYSHRTVWASLDLRRVVNLDAISHGGPSSIGLDTVEASAGQIPESFLRGCGVADAFLAYVQSIRQGMTTSLPTPALSATPVVTRNSVSGCTWTCRWRAYDAGSPLKICRSEIHSARRLTAQSEHTTSCC
jgi:hypothetical protein